jgi:hypothetical protein
MVVSLILVNSTVMAAVDPAENPTKDGRYRNLFQSLGSSSRTGEFIAFTDFAKDPEYTDRGASLDYLSARPDLIERIRGDLGSREIRWQLEDLSSRLLYVPENREEVAGLFTDYCRETIHDLLDRTGLANPYCSISTSGNDPAGQQQDQGIKAVIVQDLAREYVARYLFSGNTEKRIKVDLSGRTTIDEVGSYTSYIHYSEENGGWRFLHDRQTVWKSVSANPYTVLMTPLEETLHIALREHTEKAILAAINGLPETPSLQQIHALVEGWLAVEEAIVGGLVYSLIPEVVIRRIPDLPRAWIEDDLVTKAKFPKYRLLPRAIKLVRDFGLKESIQLYRQDPVAARKLLEKAGPQGS